VVHTGLVDVATAEMLADAGIDAAMLDVIADDVVAREVYHLDNGADKIRHSLAVLENAGIPVVPHVMVGLYYGQLRGEVEALHLISEFSPKAIVIIVLNPLRHTPMESLTPPSPEAVGRVTLIARLGFPSVPLLLGCARPLGSHKVHTDRYAIRAGVNGIAYVSEEGVQSAISMGLKPVFKDVCCSLAFKHVPIGD